MAEIEYNKGNYQQSEDCVQTALVLANEKGRKRDIVHAYFLLAKILIEQNKMDKAESYAQKAKDTAETHNIKIFLWQIDFILGSIFIKKGQWSKAKIELEKAKALVREMSKDIAENLRRSFFETKKIKDLDKTLNLVNDNMA
jgi:tetratricopeptide (TPR) repeat protein